MPDDAATVALVRQGDATALAEVFQAHADRLFRLAAHLLHDDADAEDVVQQAFVSLLAHREAFDGRSQLGTWLYRVAYNAAIDRLRARQRHGAEPFDEEAAPLPMPSLLTRWERAPDQRAIDTQVRQRLDAAVQALPASLRAVFVLRDIEDLTTTETAAALGITEGAAKVRLHRARLLLRERLAHEFGPAR